MPRTIWKALKRDTRKIKKEFKDWCRVSDRDLKITKTQALKFFMEWNKEGKH